MQRTIVVAASLCRGAFALVANGNTATQRRGYNVSFDKIGLRL